MSDPLNLGIICQFPVLLLDSLCARTRPLEDKYAPYYERHAKTIICKVSRDQNNPACILPNPPKQTGPMKLHCHPVRKAPTAIRDGTYTHMNHPKVWRILSAPIVAITTNMATAASPIHHTVPRKSNSITMLASWCAAPIIPKPDIANHVHDFILNKKEGMGDMLLHDVEEDSAYGMLSG